MGEPCLVALGKSIRRIFLHLVWLKTPHRLLLQNKQMGTEHFILHLYLAANARVAFLWGPSHHPDPCSGLS